LPRFYFDIITGTVLVLVYMRLNLAIFLIFGFTAIAVFGFLGMNLGGDHAHWGCLGASSGVLPCEENNPLDFSIFHISAFKNFSSAVLNAPFFAMPLLSAWTSVFFAVFILALSSKTRLIFVRLSSRSPDLVWFPLKKSLFSWQALHSDLS